MLFGMEVGKNKYKGFDPKDISTISQVLDVLVMRFLGPLLPGCHGRLWGVEKRGGRGRGEEGGWKGIKVNCNLIVFIVQCSSCLMFASI